MGYPQTISSLLLAVALACSALGTESTSLSTQDIAKIKQVHDRGLRPSTA